MKNLVQSISGAQSHQHAVVFTVDKKFLPYCLFTIDQIANLHPDRPFDFVIVTQDNLPDHPMLRTHNIRICNLADDAVGADFPHTDRISVATYLRFYIARALSSYSRLLYLDSDLYIRRGNFAKLLSADMGKHPLAGARDPVQFRHPKRHPSDMKGLGLGPFKYLSAGVQLIDTSRYNSLQIGEAAVKLAVSQPEKMTVYDQTAINAVLRGNFAELPPIWNWLYGFRTIYFTEIYDPPIIHFAGRRKPWNTFNGEIPARYCVAYSEFFKKHFPELTNTLSVAKPISENRLAHMRYLFNHMNGLRRLVPAIDCFKHKFDMKIEFLRGLICRYITN